MSRGMIFLVIGILLLIFLWQVGPRVHVDEKLHGGPIGEDVEKFLRVMEGNYSDIVPGAEQCIVWADSTTKAKTDLSIVYLHGFSASRQEVAPLTEIVADSLNANVFYTRLDGHGRTPEALGQARASSWIAGTRQAIDMGERIGNKVIVIGTSTGGTLATWLAALNDEPNIAAFILLSPNYGPVDRKSTLLNWRWATLWVPLVVPETRSWEAENEKQEKYWTTSYPFKVLFQMMALVKMVNEKDLSQAQAPTLFIFSPDDPVVDGEAIARAYEQYGSPIKEKIIIDDPENGNLHVVAGDILSANRTRPLAKEIVRFINGLTLKGDL